MSDPMTLGGFLALSAALGVTPVAWRVLRGAARPGRIAAASLCPVAVAGIVASVWSFGLPGLEEATTLTVILSLVTQGFLLPFLVLLPRKAPAEERR